MRMRSVLYTGLSFHVHYYLLLLLCRLTHTSIKMNSNTFILKHIISIFYIVGCYVQIQIQNPIRYLRLLG
jgi:hypothetical protein